MGDFLPLAVKVSRWPALVDKFEERAEKLRSLFGVVCRLEKRVGDVSELLFSEFRADWDRQRFLRR